MICLYQIIQLFLRPYLRSCERRRRRRRRADMMDSARKAIKFVEELDRKRLERHKQRRNVKKRSIV